MRRDLMNSVHPVVSTAPVIPTAATAIVGAIIDTQGYSSLTYLIALGTMAATAVTGTVLMEAGDDAALSDAVAVPDAELVGSEALAGFIQSDDGETRKIGYVGVKRYVRLTITPTSNDAALPIAVLALLGHPDNGSTDNPPA